MHFSDIIGQQHIILQLKKQIEENHVPHAQLFFGSEGTGKLPVALAFAKALLCRNRNGLEPCHTCNDCKMAAQYAHPDLHFVYPIIKTKSSEHPEHVKFVQEWRSQLLISPWLTRQRWNEAMNVNNQQPIIYESQSDSLIKELSLVSQKENGFKVVIFWQPECMNIACANKLLKTLEEPTGKTAFILVSNRPDMLLPTILSRVQQLKFSPLSEKDIANTLIYQRGIDEKYAHSFARIAQGNFIKALQQIEVSALMATFFDMFVQLMRLAYMRDIKQLSVWADMVSGWGREQQKQFLDYCLHLIRENFIYNFHVPELNYLTEKEEDFSKRFARFINERNVIGISNEFSLALRDIEANVNPQMVFFDLCLKIIILLIK